MGISTKLGCPKNPLSNQTSSLIKANRSLSVVEGSKFLLSFLIVVFFAIQCSTSYAYNRKKDFYDIFTIGIEDPTYGSAVRLGPLSFGILFIGGETQAGKKDKGKGYGLRGGSFAKYFSQQLVFGILGGEIFYSGEPKMNPDTKKPEELFGIPAVQDERDNLKSHKVKYLSFYHDPPKERQKRQKQEAKKMLVNKILKENSDPTLLAYLPPENPKPYGYTASYLFQIEFMLGIHYGTRIGFNIAELLDFLLGIATIDILDDDVKKDKEEEEPPLVLPPGMNFPQ
ncbi:MAG: hypothetical protein H7A23_21610 [Leptospiraceae bacterium]|nr:hypothetical protein [Leptospiraceae bacterium]MCP5497161.1 hypothetical protein [Leptospiraceae bacterium]